MTKFLPAAFSLEAATTALFLDFDGTLVPLQDDPDKVFLPSTHEQIVMDCAARMHGALVLISGRDIRDLARRAPPSVWRLGNHGLYRAAPGEQPMIPDESPDGDVLDAINSKISQIPGVWCEEKGPVICVHYRAAPQYETALQDFANELVSDKPEIKCQFGNNIVEFKPLYANKGISLGKMMDEHFRGRIPVMVGDDTTDEDGFIEAKKRGGTGIRVGSVEKTAADFFLSDIEGVYELMRRIQ